MSTIHKYVPRLFLLSCPIRDSWLSETARPIRCFDWTQIIREVPVW
jgi:hypothetical protein